MSEDEQFSEIWADALRVYKSETNRDLSKDKAVTKIQTVDDLLADIEAQEGKFKAFLDNKKKLWSILKISMEPVKVLGDAAVAALQGTPFASAGAIFTATSYLVKSAKDVSDAYALIIELFERLADFSDRLSEYAKDVIDLKLRKKITLILATLLEILAKSEKAISRGRVKEFARVAFLRKDDGIVEAFNRLQVLVDAEGRFVSAKTLSTVQKLDKDVGRLGSSLIESRKEKMEETERKSVDDALNSPAVLKVTEIQAHNANERQDGSGDWLMDEKLYMSWLNSEEPMLWILGGPGSGKSFLASTVVSYLEDTHLESQNLTRVSVGYFYIQEDDAQLRSLNTILKSLAYQLQDQDPVYARFLVKACSSPQKTITAADTWKNIFLDYFGSTQWGDKLAFIVLDGIDEAPRKEREALFKLLKDLEDSPTKTMRPRIQVLLIGRLDLREDTIFIWEKPIIYIEVSARKTKNDILAYIKSNVGRVRALRQAREPLESRLKLRKEIISKLSDGANGMFLWVNLMLDQIYDMSRPSDINDALNNAPKNLSTMIRHIFVRLDEDLRGFRKDDFKEILSWVTCAQRPLKLAELRTVLQLRPPVGEGVPDLEERLRGQFASFFTLTRRDGMTTEALLQREPHPEKRASSEENESDTEASNDDTDESGDGSDDESKKGSASLDESLLPEVQTSDPYDSDFYTTVIQFSHASIRDYLIRESNPATREFASDIGICINTVEAEKRLTIMCLQILTEGLKLPSDVDWETDTSDDDSDDGSTSSSDNGSDNSSDNSSGDSKDGSGDDSTESSDDMNPVFDLEDYAAINFMKHLTHTQKSSLTVEDEKIITRCLLGLFTVKKSITHWIDGTDGLSDTAKEWLSGPKYAEFVRGWFLNQVLNTDYYTEVEVEQMKKLAESDQELLKSAARQCAEYWLTVDDEFESFGGYVAFLNEYVPKEEDGTEGVASASESTSGKKISQARLRKLANFFNFEKTSFWHAHLAEAFHSTGHNGAAIESFETAIKLDDKNWVAMGRLSICYEDIELYELATEWARKALAAGPTAGHKWERAQYLQTIAACLLDLKDLEGARAAAKAACDLLPESGDMISTYIFVLEADRDHAEVMAYLEDLQSRISEKEDENLLTVTLMANDYLVPFLGHVARAAGKLDFMIKAQETAIEAAIRDEDLEEIPNQQGQLAELYYTNVKDIKKAVEIWETVVKNKGTSTRTMASAVEYLSLYYYEEATSSQKQKGKGKSARHWIAKLEKLAKYDNEKHEASISGASLMLGLWYFDHGNIAEAKNCCRSYMLQSLDLLTDDDPYNDDRAWLDLARCLMTASDRVNGAAAYAVVAQEFDRLKAAITLKAAKASMRSETTAPGDNNDSSEAATLPSAISALEISSPLSPPSDAQQNSDHSPSITVTNTNTNTNSTIIVDSEPTPNPSIPIPVSDLPLTSEWYCDGRCRRDAELWTEVYICEICLEGTCFCEQCIHLIRGDKLDFKVCSPGHRWHKAYPVEEAWGLRSDVVGRKGGGEVGGDEKVDKDEKVDGKGDEKGDDKGGEKGDDKEDEKGGENGGEKGNENEKVDDNEDEKVASKDSVIVPVVEKQKVEVLMIDGVPVELSAWLKKLREEWTK